ncbi:MAG: hypothetical protein P8012_15940 [Desulfobacterales bacterium]
MKIAYIHYHLKPGGVTTVLKQQVDAVSDICEVLVLAGSLPDSPFPCGIVHIPGLGYDIYNQNFQEPENVANAVIEAVHSKWKDGCDLLHIHNPTLNKNKNFLKILNILEKRGFRLFLQIHDFAEDGRPLSYYAEEDYIHDCHYGVINSRDYDILLKSDLNKEGVHKIFNTVKPFSPDRSRKAKTGAFESTDGVRKHHVLYPVRAIRRKNIGEAILLSLFFKNNTPLVITLPPNSPADIKSYEDWKMFVIENNLNVVFEAGLIHEFSDLVLSADFFITTSIGEGFGFSFLEPWTAHKMLWGRKLPDICKDFEKNSIRLDHLYTRLDVPIDWIDKQRFFDVWKAGVQKVGAAFRTSMDGPSIENAYKNIIAANTIDFGMLNESFQKTIIRTLLSGDKNRNRMLRLNPFLSNPGDVSNKNELIQSNMKAVLLNYTPLKYGEKLIDIYKKVIRKSVHHKINKQKLLAQFLTPNHFSLLKWCDDA